MNNNNSDFNFEQAWQKIDSLEQKGLYKSALKIVNEIYIAAGKNKKGDQKIKALFYKGKYSNYLEEDNLESFEKTLQYEIANSSFPETQLYQSILAEFYDKYLIANSWKINNRTETGDSLNDDIQTWTAGRFIEESNKLYNKSISDSRLEDISYTNYKEIFTDAINTEKMRDNLYEILVYRALNHFKNDRNYLPKTTKVFNIDNAKYFDVPTIFTTLKLNFQDKNDPKFKTLSLFQQLEKHNLKEKDFEELISVTLNRLEFVTGQYLKEDKEKLYLKTLNNLIEKYPSQNAIAEVYYKIASIYSNKGELLKWKIKEARDICLLVEEKYPNTFGESMCKQLRFQIEKKQLNFKTEKVNLPNENLLTKIEYKNLDKVFFRLIKLNQNQEKNYKKLQKGQFDYVKSLEVLKSWEIDLPNDGDFRKHAIESEIMPLEKGVYILLISNNSNFKKDLGVVAYQFLYVSNLVYWTRADKTGNYIFVVDRKTGKAIENAMVELSYLEWDRRDRKRIHKIFLIKTTNSQGYIHYKSSDKYRNYIISVSKGNDILNIDENIYYDRIYPISSTNNVMFFTDRSIYRPGQTVYYKGIYLHYDNEKIPSIKRNKKDIKIEFKDANYQKVDDAITYTNEFGSFNGSFTIPSSGLTGNMIISEPSTGSSISFKVEEYKRPKFEVTFEDYKKSYKLGDKINIKGLASSFSGFPIQDAKVIYTVKRKVFYPYFFYYFRPAPKANNVEIAHGETITDNNGNFTIPVELFAKDIEQAKYLPSFVFEVNASVVDMTGETHSAIKRLNAGVTDVNISMQVDNKIKSDKKLDINISATNHSGQKVDAKGEITIFKLNAPKKIFRDRFWNKPDTFIYSQDEFYKKFPSYAYKNDDDKHFWEIENTVDKIDFNTKEKEEYKLDLPVGEYKIVLHFDDPSGKKINIERYLSVYSDKVNPALTMLLTETDKYKYNPPAAAIIHWQSSIKDLNVYYSIWSRNNNILGKQWLDLSNTKNLTIKVLDELRGGVIIANTYVYNNRFYQDSKTIYVPWSNKDLKFEYTSFRSKLYPGQDEEWRIKIKGEKSDKLISEILANMYDASLDKIYQRDWQRNIYYPVVNFQRSNSFGFGISPNRFYYSEEWRKYGYEYYQRSFRKLNWFGFNIRSYRGGLMYDRVEMRSMKKDASIDRVGGVPPTPPPPPPQVEEMEIDGFSNASMENNEIDNSNNKTSDNSEVQIRTNLNETVFFYPDIITDEDGNFVLKFKMNDALTKWKFRVFAHSKDLKFGYDEKEIITQKELMITPNNPRFVREGDQLIFNARIDNLTDNDLNGNSWIELFDAETMKSVETIFLKGQKNVDFSLNSKGSTMVSWKMEFPKNVSNLLIYRFFAKAGDFSDAEEGILPVLTNQKLVTETMPLWVGGNQTKEFIFKSLKNSKGKDLKNINFTIEATSHPIWLAIQSLPYLKDVKCKNSISYTNALFANLLAKKITDDNPKIKRIFEKWNNANSDIDKEALLSNLSKNQELKNILLEETPWVLDAIDEEQQKRNIALLFDLNQVRNDKRAFIGKLKGLQNPDGGFPWFTGGKSSRYITQYIVETFGRMKKLGLLNKEREIDKILRNAIIFVNEDVVKDYKKLLELSKEGKIDLKDNHLGSLMIHYMYAIQFYPEINKNKDLQEAYDYYFSQAKKYCLNRPLYLKGMLALVLHRDNETAIAKEILKAADEQSIFNEELGRYWKSYHGYHWWQLPIETQALMIEAFDEINNDKTIVDQLKIWLLKNKQTNRWKTDKATVSAIYSLLFDNGGTIGETGLVKIFVEGNDITKTMAKNNIQAGTGYYKKKWLGTEVKSDMSNIKIVNPNKDIAWGAAYWQYLQDLDKIESFEDTPLKIQRTLYLVKNTDKGEKMTEIRQGDKLNPGDLIKVKIRLQVDREMEFVHLSDQRAATFEPLEQLSGYRWQGGLGYYQNPRDSKMNFFIDFLPRGVFVLEYPLRVTQSGTFSNGIAELQSYYAPEFSSHSEGLKVIVK